MVVALSLLTAEATSLVAVAIAVSVLIAVAEAAAAAAAAATPGAAVRARFFSPSQCQPQITLTTASRLAYGNVSYSRVLLQHLVGPFLDHRRPLDARWC